MNQNFTVARLFVVVYVCGPDVLPSGLQAFEDLPPGFYRFIYCCSLFGRAALPENGKRWAAAFRESISSIKYLSKRSNCFSTTGLLRLPSVLPPLNAW